MDVIDDEFVLNYSEDDDLSAIDGESRKEIVSELESKFGGSFEKLTSNYNQEPNRIFFPNNSDDCYREVLVAKPSLEKASEKSSESMDNIDLLSQKEVMANYQDKPSLAKRLTDKNVVIDHLPPINMLNSRGESALSIMSSRCFLSGIKLLLECGADASFRDENNFSLLHLVFEVCDDVDEIDQPYPCARWLIEYGADVNIVSKDGRTALMLACDRGDDKSVLLLIHNGANTSVTDENANTALHYAAQRNHLNCIGILLTGEDLLTTSNIPKSISLSGEATNEDVTKEPEKTEDYFEGCTSLSDTHLDIWDQCFRNALQSFSPTKSKGNEEERNIGVRGPSESDVIRFIIQNNDCSKMMFLFENGFNAYATDKNGNAFFHIAALYDSYQIMETALRRYSDDLGHLINVPNNFGETPYDIATRLQNNECASLLNKYANNESSTFSADNMVESSISNEDDCGGDDEIEPEIGAERWSRNNSLFGSLYTSVTGVFERTPPPPPPSIRIGVKKDSYNGKRVILSP